MEKKPNIILIMTDQQRADASAREEFPLDTTPFLDALAQQGTWFNHAYCAAPVCGPSRVSTLTGRFPSAHNVRENRGTSYAHYEEDIIDVVKKQGYKTALIGKNHSHLTPEKLDNFFQLEHDAGYGTPDPKTELEDAFDHWLRKVNHSTVMEPAPFPVETQGPFRAVSNAEDWISSVKSENEEQPFFMWLSFAEPHNPYQVPEPYFSMFPPETLPPLATDKEELRNKSFKWQFTRNLGEYYFPDYEKEIARARANYFGMLRLIDDQVKRLADYLEQNNLMHETVIIFVSDHGDFAGEYGLMRKGPEVPEVLMRVPMFVVGPGIQSQKKANSAFVSLVDIMPTICEMLDIDIPNGVQGRSLLPLLTGESYPEGEFRSIYAEQGFGGLHYTKNDEINYEHCGISGPVRPSFDEMNSYSQSGAMRMIRKEDWKLAIDMNGEGQLYDLSVDPLELNNLFNNPDHQQKQMEMLTELTTWMLRMQDPLPYPKNKYIYKRHPRNYWTEEIKTKVNLK